MMNGAGIRIVCMGLLIVGFVGGCESVAPTPTAVGGGAPAEVLAKLGVSGRMALIEFGVIGCELSEGGFAEMVRMARAGDIADLAFARVVVGSDAATAEAYRDGADAPFVVAADPDKAMAVAFAATAAPTFVLVDRFGNIRYRGKFPAETLDEWVEAMAAETADPGPKAALFGVTKLDGARLLAATRLPELKGPIKPLADYAGPDGVVLVFIDTACPFSSEAMNDIPSVAKTLAERDVPLVAVNLDDVESEVREFYKTRDLGVPVVFDVTTSTKLTWGVQSVPTVVYVDGEGAVLYNGKALWADLAAAMGPARPEAKTIKFQMPGTGFG